MIFSTSWLSLILGVPFTSTSLNTQPNAGCLWQVTEKQNICLNFHNVSILLISMMHQHYYPGVFQCHSNQCDALVHWDSKLFLHWCHWKQLSSDSQTMEHCTWKRWLLFSDAHSDIKKEMKIIEVSLFCNFDEEFSSNNWQVCQIPTVNSHSNGLISQVIQGQSHTTEV